MYFALFHVHIRVHCCSHFYMTRNIVVAQLLHIQSSHSSLFTFWVFCKVLCLHSRSWVVFIAPHLVFNTSFSQQAKPGCWHSLHMLANPCSTSQEHISKVPDLQTHTFVATFKHFNSSCHRRIIQYYTTGS